MTATSKRRACERHELVYDPDLHAYALDGLPLPPVTTIKNVLNAPQLNEWKMREAARAVLEGRARSVEQAVLEVENVAKAARDFGTALHAAAAAIARGHKLLPLALGERWQPTVDLVAAWLDRNLVEVLYVEETMASPALKVAGRPDLICRLVGHKLPTIIDYKTGKNVYPGDILQQSGYRAIAREWVGLTCDRLILHLPAPEYGDAPVLRPVPLRAHGIDERAFLNELQLWHWEQGVRI